jgi:hypothetical protein
VLRKSPFPRRKRANEGGWYGLVLKLPPSLDLRVNFQEILLNEHVAWITNGLEAVGAFSVNGGMLLFFPVSRQEYQQGWIRAGIYEVV